MRETRQSGSEGGGSEPNRFSLPLLTLTDAGMTCLSGSAPRRARREIVTVAGLRNRAGLG